MRKAAHRPRANARLGRAGRERNMAKQKPKKKGSRAAKRAGKRAAKGARARAVRGTGKTNARAAGAVGKKQPASERPAAGVEGLPLFDHTEEPSEAPAAPSKRSTPAGAASLAEPASVDLPLDALQEEDAAPKRTRGKKTYETAETIARRQREISISEFFAKNRHLLGFDSLPKALLTAVKEAVDNSLDACEEAGILPDLLVEIREIAENRYRVIIGDSGPGIVKAQVPKIFGKLLYGSKFHVLKQARGQQGIGISAAVMYSQLTTGKPARVITRTSPRQPAHVYELQIHTKTNTPVIVSEGTLDWERPHGTQVEIELLATYKKGQRSVDEYLHQVAMANPARADRLSRAEGPRARLPAAHEPAPRRGEGDKPHPHGIELGVLLDMLKVTHARNIKGFLEHEFSRMSAKTSLDILAAAKIAPTTSPKRITREQGDDLIRAFGAAKIMKPPTDCLSPIGEELLLHSVQRESDPEFFTAVTRPPAVYRGNPFQIEAAIAYGGRCSPPTRSSGSTASPTACRSSTSSRRARSRMR